MCGTRSTTWNGKHISKYVVLCCSWPRFCGRFFLLSFSFSQICKIKAHFKYEIVSSRAIIYFTCIQRAHTHTRARAAYKNSYSLLVVEKWFRWPTMRNRRGKYVALELVLVCMVEKWSRLRTTDHWLLSSSFNGRNAFNFAHWRANDDYDHDNDGNDMREKCIPFTAIMKMFATIFKVPIFARTYSAHDDAEWTTYATKIHNPMRFRKQKKWKLQFGWATCDTQHRVNSMRMRKLI